MRISIVIPSFNQGQFLAEALDSIINQSFQETEIIVIDGGSSDETGAVLERYKKHIAYMVSEKDSGQSEALNKGFARATGDVFGWMNADDRYEPGAFAEVAGIFTEHSKKTICYGDWITINAQGALLERHFALPPRTPRFPYENLDAYNQSMFWRRGAHDRFGRFDEKLHRLMDDDLILALLINEGPERFYRTSKVLGAFRIHEGQKTPDVRFDERRMEEEHYLETKYGFAPAESVAGRLCRFSYRLFQLLHGIKDGGFAYTYEKARSGLKKRGGLL